MFLEDKIFHLGSTTVDRKKITRLSMGGHEQGQGGKVIYEWS